MNRFRCPYCGAMLEVKAVRDGPRSWTKQETRSYALGDVQLPPTGARLYRREPARNPVREDVLVPAAWAGITSLAIGLGTIPVTLWQGWSWWTPATVAAGGFAISWLILLADWRKALWRVEEITHADPDGDREEEPREEPVHIELEDKDGRNFRYIDLPTSDEELHRVAVEVLLNGRAFSRRALNGVIGAEKFRRLQRAMLKAGLIVFPSGPRGGAELTAAGRAILRHYLEKEE